MKRSSETPKDPARLRQKPMHAGNSKAGSPADRIHTVAAPMAAPMAVPTGAPVADGAKRSFRVPSR